MSKILIMQLSTKNEASARVQIALLESSFDVDSDTLLNLAIKPIERITIQRKSMTKFPLILAHISSNLNNKTARLNRRFVGTCQG